ncbi:MAG: helix-turn-helix transcriptional regulator [Dehalococcoidia bacterium]|nr:helix-turn-helix transcriptional regulator [Dehalococcoidia bacterium]MYA52948.1 helix-turn-helix transcriptional regulator [Dehalococcoidia bacterium]
MARRGRPPHPDVLTPAEWRVLEELRAGGTYVEVAVRLGIQVGTVKFHARNIREKLHLETREQLIDWRHEREAGGRRRAFAPLAVFTSYFQPALSSAAVVVVGGAAIAAGVLAYAIANSGEPPEYPALPATSEEERDTAATPPSATRTPTASPVPTAAPAPPSLTPPAPESSDDGPAIHFWGDVPEYQQVAVRARTASVVEFFEARYGVRVPDLEVHVGADDAALEDATEDAAGVGISVYRARYVDGLLFVRMDASEYIEHLYFQAIQDHLSQGRGGPRGRVIGPGWLNQGTAMYASQLYQDARGERSLDEAMDSNRRRASYMSGTLAQIASGRSDGPWTDPGGSLAALAAIWLVERGGEGALVDYYRQLGSKGWREAFEGSFGIPHSEVHSAFAAHRAETVAVRRDVSGVVLGPDGEPVEDWRVDIKAYPEGAQHTLVVFEDVARSYHGDFTLRLPDGAYVLLLEATCPGGWGQLGWYGGAGGLITGQEDATRVVVEGESIEGLVIRLPSLPDEKVRQRCSSALRVAVSGVVVGPDGQPRPNVYLSSHDPATATWSHGTFSAADGSFTLSLPAWGAYPFGVDLACDLKGMSTPIDGGEHVIEGDVQLDADGLLVVADEDVAGVIIRLRHALSCSSD